jgi:hypothetical protein
LFFLNGLKEVMAMIQKELILIHSKNSLTKQHDYCIIVYIKS